MRFGNAIGSWKHHGAVCRIESGCLEVSTHLCEAMLMVSLEMFQRMSWLFVLLGIFIKEEYSTWRTRLSFTQVDDRLGFASLQLFS